MAEDDKDDLGFVLVEITAREGVHYFVNAAGYPQVLETLLPVKGITDFELGEVR